MKHIYFLTALFCLTLTANAINKKFTSSSPVPANIKGGVMDYTGKIGPYAVEFSYMNLHMGDGAHFMYRYTSVRVNKGEWIELKYVKNNGKYQIWKEYINGKNTGTFTILWTRQYIKGSFVNSKGKKYTVNAKYSGGNWADTGDSPF